MKQLIFKDDVDSWRITVDILNGEKNIGYYIPNIDYLVLYDNGYYFSYIKEITDWILAYKKKNKIKTYGITYKVNGDKQFKELCNEQDIKDAKKFLLNFHNKADDIKIIRIEEI